VTRWLACCALAASALLGASCKPTTRCEDLLPEPNSGNYHGGGTLGEERILNLSVAANTREVVLSFTTRDGSKVRATYRVTKKTRRP
jgi:hypothetical protein